MLRAVTLENFIRLKERQQLQFAGGTYLFIGENGSGKSSVLEAIRRCLSVRVNTAFSTIGYPQNDSYVVCKYDHDGCRMSGCSTLLACQFYLGEKEEQKYNKSRYKLAALLDKNNEVLDIGVDFAREADEGSGLKNCSVELEATEKTKLREAIRQDLSVDKTAVAAVFDILRHHHNKIALPSRRQDDTKSELILSKLDETFVFLFENRGISPLQMADCRKRAEEWRYQHRVQIIKHFLDDLSDEETERGNEIFRTITDNLGLEFEIKKGDEAPLGNAKMDDEAVPSLHSSRDGSTTITRTDEHESLRARVTVKEGGINCDILKTPEGFLQAKQCSLILARTYFKTICLEDPGRGMNPQMIQRFRDMVLWNRKLETRTILITTHNPAFMAPWTVPKTFVFRRKQEGESISQKIIPGNLLLRSDDKRMPRFLTSTSSELPRLFFSRKLIIVEGDNDLKFLTALKYKILQGAEEVRNILKHIGTEKEEGYCSEKDVDNEFTKLKQFMSAVDTIQMAGETNKERIREICRTLELDYFFLLNKNAVVINDSPKGANVHKLLNVEKVFDYKSCFGVKPEVNDSNWGSIREEFYQHGIYIWRNGDLEDMVIEIPGKPEQSEEGKIKEHDLHRQLREENHVIPLDHYQKKKPRARCKLYSSKKITDGNIEKGMEIMLKACNGQQNDLVEFIGFLRKGAQEDFPERDEKENQSECSWKRHTGGKSSTNIPSFIRSSEENGSESSLKRRTGEKSPTLIPSFIRSSEVPFLRPALLREHIKEKGNKSKETQRLLQWICSRVEASITTVQQVWPGYKVENTSEPVFVAIAEKQSKDHPKVRDQDTFQVILRNNWQVSDEAKHVIRVEQERKLQFKDEESSNLQACLIKHSKNLMKKHSNLNILSASKIKSRKFGTEKASRDEQTCIVFYVHVKGVIPFDEEPFPTELDGFSTDVREGLFYPYSDPCVYHQNLMMGCQIGTAYGTCGTLGAFVALPNGNIGCLTNFHLFVTEESKSDYHKDINHIDFNTAVYQPHKMDENFKFGHLRLYSLDPGDENNIGVDAALIEITEAQRQPRDGNFPEAVSNMAGFSTERPMVFNSGKIVEDFSDVPKSCNVVKYGCKTGHTRGHLRLAGPAVHKQGFAYQLSINSPDTHELHQQFEVEHIEGQPFSDFGDSGSLVFLVKDDGDDYDITALGLLVGGTSHGTTIVTPIWAVLKKFGLLPPLLSFGAVANTGVQADTSESLRLGILEVDVANVITDVSSLKSDMGTLTVDMTTVNSQLTAVKSDVANLQQDMTSVKSVVTSVQGDVDSIKTSVSKMDCKMDQKFQSMESSIQAQLLQNFQTIGSSLQSQMAEMKTFFQSFAMSNTKKQDTHTEDSDSDDL